LTQAVAYGTKQDTGARTTPLADFSVASSAVEQMRRILIVGDDRDGTHLIKILLAKIGGYLVLEENDAAKAHQRARDCTRS
jgi:hypothetical protein